MKNKHENRKLNFYNPKLFYFLLFFIFINLSFAANYDLVSQYYSIGIGQDANGADISVELNNTFIENTFYNKTNTYVNITKTGLYKISYSCRWISTSANGRHIMDNWIYKNNATEIVPSRRSCYIRNDGDGNSCSNSATLLANLTTNDFIELKGGKFDGATGETITGSDCSLYIKKIDSDVIEVYDSAGGQDFGAGEIIVNLDTLKHTDPAFSLGTDRININENGWFKIYYTTCGNQQTDVAGGNVRQTHRAYLRLNGISQLMPSETKSYTRDEEDGNGDRNCNSASLMMNLSSGDYVELMKNVTLRNSIEQVDTIANQSWIMIEKIKPNYDKFLAYESAGGQIITNNDDIAVTFDTTHTNGSNITHSTTTNPSRINFNKTGLYEISFNLGYDDSNAGRVIGCGYIRKNGTDTIIPSRTCAYSRGNSGNREASVTNSIIINITAGDYLELIANPVGSDIEIIRNETWFSAVEIKQNGLITNSYDTLTPITYSALSGDVFEVNVTVDCNNFMEGSCYNVSSYLLINTSPTSFSNMSSVFALPSWTQSEQPQSCLLEVGDSCQKSWDINVTALSGVKFEIKVLSQSNLSDIKSYLSDTVTLDIVDGNTVRFNQTEYSFESFSRFSGVKNTSLLAISEIGANNNITVNCIQGDCTQLTQNFPNGINLAKDATREFEFFCDDNQAGIYSALFNITSNEFSSYKQINISCNVTQVLGPIQLTLNSPTPNNINGVLQNLTFELNGTLSCVGNCGNVTAYAIYNNATVFGDGSEGSVTVNSLNTIVNDYDYLTGNELSGDNVITLNDATNFNIGDEIMIVQMQNYSNGDAGSFEYAKISSKLGNDLTLDTSLQNSYYSGTFADSEDINATATQVVRIPNYLSVTIDGGSIVAPLWNGRTGGIVAFRVKEILNFENDGFINTSSRGFRGGTCGDCGDDWDGGRGEGINGWWFGGGVKDYPDEVSLNFVNGGGGSRCINDNGGDPGAGGGYATAGQTVPDVQSIYDSTGGSAIGDAQLNNIYFGGGGGAGSDNDGATPFSENSHGGGIAIIKAKQIFNATIYARGEKGITSCSSSSSGISGGGAGGTIWISSLTIDILNVSALGGSGEYGDCAGGGERSGDGSDGRIRLDYLQIKGNSNPSSGFNGSGEDLLSVIPIVSTSPFWSITSNPLWCEPGIDGNCTFSYQINASGNIGDIGNFSIIAISNYSSIKFNKTTWTVANISENLAPVVNLLSPSNNEKILSNGSVIFEFQVIDGDPQVNCTLFINSTIFDSFNCNTGTTLNYTAKLPSGKHNWSVQVIDSDTNTVNSEIRNFTLIKNYHIKLNKSIKSIGEDMYLIKLNITNKENSTNFITPIEYENERFNFGSLTPANNWINITYNNFPGSILGWDITINPLEDFEINYSITKNTNDYYLARAFIASLD